MQLSIPLQIHKINYLQSRYLFCLLPFHSIKVVQQNHQLTPFWQNVILLNLAISTTVWLGFFCNLKKFLVQVQIETTFFKVIVWARGLLFFLDIFTDFVYLFKFDHLHWTIEELLIISICFPFVFNSIIIANDKNSEEKGFCWNLKYTCIQLLGLNQLTEYQGAFYFPRHNKKFAMITRASFSL